VRKVMVAASCQALGMIQPEPAGNQRTKFATMCTIFKQADVECNQGNLMLIMSCIRQCLHHSRMAAPLIMQD
jgi:hypothetical protein